MTYEFAQSALTLFIQTVVVGSACVFALAAHHHALKQMRLQPPAIPPEETTSSAPQAEVEQSTDPDQPSARPAAEQNTDGTLTPASPTLQPVLACSATPMAHLRVVPETAPDATNTLDKASERDRLQHLNTTQLRKECGQCHIKWRNAYGNGKHLKKPEMIAALLDKCAQSSPIEPALATV